MRTITLKIITLLLFSVVFITSKAQSAWSAPDCLGTHCYITVYINRDPVVEGGYLKYTINVPAEGVVDVQGPAGSFLFNNLGNTIDFYVRKSHLDLAADGVNCEVPFELLVNKWVTPLGIYNTNGNGIQCYYWIKLIVNYE